MQTEQQKKIMDSLLNKILNKLEDEGGKIGYAEYYSFISYIRFDKKTAQELLRILESEGIIKKSKGGGIIKLVKGIMAEG